MVTINRQGVTLSVLGCGVALLVACGSDGHGPFVTPGGDGGSPAIGNRAGAGGRAATAGAAGSGGSSGKSGASSGGEAGAIENSPFAPLVRITSPVEVTNPTNGPVVLEQVHVVCEAKASDANNASFAASSVSIEALDADGKSVQKSAGTRDTKAVNEFFADFVLTRTQVPNGAISFKCTAKDLSTPPNVGSDLVSTYIDHGPLITVMSPALPTAQNVLDYRALNTAVPFRFTVVPDPLTAKDTQSAVGGVTLRVNNVPIDLSAAESATTKGTYQIDLRLDDKEKFKVTPNGAVSVDITATNKRAPLPTDHPEPLKAQLAYNFGVDGAGPQITIVSPSPLNAPVVGVAVKLQFSLKDVESGVDPSTVNVSLNSTAAFYDAASSNWSRTGDNYTYNIPDTKAASGSKIQLSVVVNAYDNSKNKALPATAQYWLDTSAPIVDLDPPNVQEVKSTSDGLVSNCSDPFDVLGAVSPSEGDTLKPPNILRALVWDVTNSTADQTIFHYAGVDPVSVRLYAQDDATQPLLIDADGDGVCESLATEGTQGVVHAPVPFELHPLDAKGEAKYMTSSPAINGVCTAVTSNGTPIQNLCSQHISDMSRVIDHALGDGKEDVVYTVTSASELECTGKAVDISGTLANGWVCLAAEAQDNVGNHGISAPIRVCLNEKNHSEPACANSSVAKPSCVSNCTPPPHFSGSYVRRLN